MPRGPAPAWRALKEPVLDDHIRVSIEQANGTPDPETGRYATVHYVGCETRERAAEVKRGLFRAAKRQKVSVAATVKPAGDGTFYVEFTAIDKRYARAYILSKHGPDRSKWPYDPRKGNETA